MPENKQKYLQYFSSWACSKTREEAMRQYGRSCMRCKIEHDLHVHHMTYERLFNEKLSDLAVLCFRCHKLYHKLHKKASIETTKDFISNVHLVYFPKSKKKKHSFEEGVLLGYSKMLIKENRRPIRRIGGLLDDI